MDHTINELKIMGFVIDDMGQLKTPMFFEKESISRKSKEIFKKIARFCILKSNPVITDEELIEIVGLDNNSELQELKDKKYLFWYVGGLQKKFLRKDFIYEWFGK